MRRPTWIFSVRYLPTKGLLSGRHRWAVVGPARASTVEAVLHLAALPEDVQNEVRTCQVVRDFIEGKLDPEGAGRYYSNAGPSSWVICIGPVHVVLADPCPVCEGPHDDAKHREVRRRERGGHP